MGDVAMLVPVVVSLAKCYPQLRITVLSKAFARALFENVGENVGFMEADVSGENKGIHGLNLLYRRLSAKHFTAVADMHDVLRTKYLRMRFLIDNYKVEHIDKHRSEKRELCSGSGRLRQLPTSFDNYADVLARLGYPVKPDFVSLFPPQGGSLRLLPPSVGEKKSFRQWIGIAPFAAHKGKVYPLDRMEAVVRTVIQRHPSCRIFLFGGGNAEKETLDKWAGKYPQCINVSAVLEGLSQELILMSHLDVMVSMDSANMHLASVTATPVVSIWGATHPYAGFMGWNQDYANAIQVELPCRPCSVYGNKPCHREDYACLSGIEPETVADKIDTVLNSINNIKKQKDYEKVRM